MENSIKNDATVFIIDDDQDVRQALSFLCESVDLKVKAYSNASDFLEHFDTTEQFGCIIIDVRLPTMSGLELLDHLKTKNTLLPIIVITGYGDVPMAVRVIKAGAADFVLKPINEQFLLDLIQRYLKTSPFSQLHPAKDIATRINTLTERERQVMELVLDGKMNKEIAHELCISMSTVEAHRSRVMQKMQVKNLAQLIRITLQHMPF